MQLAQKIILPDGDTANPLSLPGPTTTSATSSSVLGGSISAAPSSSNLASTPSLSSVSSTSLVAKRSEAKTITTVRYR